MCLVVGVIIPCFILLGCIATKRLRKTGKEAQFEYEYIIPLYSNYTAGGTKGFSKTKINAPTWQSFL